MRSVLLPIALLLLVLTSGCALSKLPEARVGMTKADPIVKKIQSYYKKNGRYPSELSEIEFTEEELNHMNQMEMRYTVWMADQEFALGFVLRNFAFNGPWCGFNSTVNAWRCLLK